VVDTSAIRVLLVDDSVPFRKGVANLLAAEADFELVGEAGDGAEGLELARQLVPDVVLMDISMPRMDGLEATRRIRAELPCVRIVVLTVSDERSLLGSVKSGAHGYLPKNIAPQALLDTVRRVARGEAPVSRAMAARLLEERAGDSGLTLREREVLGLVAEGEADQKIAVTLGIAESIVKNVLEKVHREHQAALGQESAASPGGGPRH